MNVAGIKDIEVGFRKGFWTVTKVIGYRNRSLKVQAKCRCGLVKVINASNLIQFENPKCRKCANTLFPSHLKHGMSETPEYNTWVRIKQRCFNKKCPDYPDYGGRGIKVCKRWLNSFENFINDMKPRPSTSHSIDRINNDGNYQPSNCRWATKKQQANNRRSKRNEN